MKNKHFAPVSLATLCLLAGAMAAVPVTGQPTGKDLTPEQLRDLWKPVKMTASEIAQHAAMPDVKRDGALVLAQLADKCKATPATDGAGKNAPNYYMYRGFKVTMPLLPKLAVQFAAKVDAEQQIQLLLQLGLAAEKVGGIGENLVLVDVTGGFASTDACRAAIEKLTASQWISFAAPVFAAPLAEDAWWMPTRDVAVSVKPELAEAGWTAAAMVGEAALELVYIEAIGNVPGVGRAAMASKNGFDAMVTANRLNSDARFAGAEPSALQRFIPMVIEPNDPLYANQWHLNNTGSQTNDINAPQAWDYTTGNSNVRVAVLDEGTQQDHPDINQSTGRDFTTGAAGGVPDGDPTSSCERHGTPVAGLVTARLNNSIGGVGVAPACLTIACKVADLNYAPNPCDRFYTGFSNTWAANALAYSIALNARVSNMSYGVGGPSVIFENQVQTNYNDGMLSVASAGNSGVAGLGYPSSAPFVISVAALNSNGTRASFSTFGTGLDISAPGVNTPSTDRTGSDGYNTSAGVAGNYTTTFSGTSASAPITAGCVALFFSNNRLATAAQAATALRFSARDLGAAGYDTDFGYGFVNADGMLEYYSPSNDSCSSARVIGTPVYTNTTSTRFATAIANEPNESCGAATNSKSVYYSFNTLDYGTATIDTNGSTYDTVMSVFNGCGFTISFGGGLPVYLAPTQIACDDDGGAGAASLISNLSLVPGTTYRIKVAEYGSSVSGGGDMTLNFNFTATAPPNDGCSTATEIPANASNYGPPVYSTRLATVNASACFEAYDACITAATGHSVWYKFRPTFVGTMTAHTEGSNYDTVLSVYRAGIFGCPVSFNGNCIPMTSVGCNDDINGSANRQSRVTELLDANTTYYIKVSEYGSSGDGGLLDFNFSYVPAACSPADINSDGIVDGNDFTSFINAFAVGDAAVAPEADIDNDGVVDGTDFTLFINAFGAGC